MTDEQLKQAPGRAAPHSRRCSARSCSTYNLPGDAKLKFTPEALADIFLGKITKWNDPRIAGDNPGVELPDQAIIVVHRSDGSGTTYVFIDYLVQGQPGVGSRRSAGARR